MNLASCGRKQPIVSSVRGKRPHLQSSNVTVKQKCEQTALIPASLQKSHITWEGGAFTWISTFRCINSTPTICPFFSPSLSGVDARNWAVTTHGVTYASKILSSWAPEMGGSFKSGPAIFRNPSFHISIRYSVIPATSVLQWNPMKIPNSLVNAPQIYKWPPVF